MPHLRLEYPAAMAKAVDMQAFAQHMRAAMAAMPVFPVGGIRVRGVAADVAAVADGGDHLFLHMEAMMGAGRDEATRREVARVLYAAAEAHLAPLLDGRPFALSLEVRELDPIGEKRWNTIHEAVGGT